MELTEATLPLYNQPLQLDFHKEEQVPQKDPDYPRVHHEPDQQQGPQGDDARRGDGFLDPRNECGEKERGYDGEIDTIGNDEGVFRLPDALLHGLVLSEAVAGAQRVYRGPIKDHQTIFLHVENEDEEKFENHYLRDVVDHLQPARQVGRKKDLNHPGARFHYSINTTGLSYRRR